MEISYTELYEKMSHLQWLLQRYHLQNHFANGPFADPTRGQGRVLAMLKVQPEISTKDLSYLLGIRQQSLNELLNKLEKAGHVVREPSENDRRVMVVKLTEKGKTEQQADTDYSGIFDCLSPEEQKSFSDYLDRVIAALENQIGMEDNEDMENWMKSARSRMGDDVFGRMMSMRGGFGGANGKGFLGGGFGLDRRGGFGPEGRGPMPDNMPGAERFDPNYDGPVPDRGEGFPFGWGKQKKDDKTDGTGNDSENK